MFNVWKKSYFSNFEVKWNDGCSLAHKNACQWFLSRNKQLVGPSKLRNRVFLEKCSKWNLNFQS